MSALTKKLTRAVLLLHNQWNALFFYMQARYTAGQHHVSEARAVCNQPGMHLCSLSDHTPFST